MMRCTLHSPRHATAAVLLLLTTTSGLARAEQPVELPVTRVALFSSGVGYFECDTAVTDDATAQLSFRTEQVNDILKSLVVQDFGGGSVGVVRYASQEPIQRTLSTYGVDIARMESLADLLAQLRGEPIELTGPRSLRGTIFNVEWRPAPSGDKTYQVAIVTLLTDEGLQQVPLEDIKSFKLQNPKVAADLQAALATLATQHDADQRPVTLRFTGKGQRPVRVGYLVETPIWKTSYRLVIARPTKDAPDEKVNTAFLQGWAHVENTTQSDWNNVELSLVSGRPISFRMDLYTPLYVPRPVEQLELYASLRPREYEAGRGGGMAAPGIANKARSERAMPLPPAPSAVARLGSAEDASAGDQRFGNTSYLNLEHTGVQSLASAKEAGELFAYPIDEPVSVPRGGAAMLPIVNESIIAEKVSLYSADQHPKYPVNGLRITNNTKLNLMQGPVTVFDDGLYAGDAKLPDLKPGEDRLIAYALDLGAEVDPSFDSKPMKVVSVRLARGVIYYDALNVIDGKYAVHNKQPRDKTVIIERPIETGWKLVTPEKPYEQTSSLLRLKVAAPAGKTVEQPLRLERVSQTQMAIANLDDGALARFASNAPLSDAVAKAFAEIARLRSELATATRAARAAEEALDETIRDQQRVRDNLRALDRSTDAYTRQLSKFDELETKIEQQRGELESLRKAEDARRAALEEYVMNTQAK